MGRKEKRLHNKGFGVQGGWKIQPEDLGPLVIDLLRMPARTLPMQSGGAPHRAQRTQETRRLSKPAGVSLTPHPFADLRLPFQISLTPPVPSCRPSFTVLNQLVKRSKLAYYCAVNEVCKTEAVSATGMLAATL